jgi:hypothetical protein
MGEPLEDPRDGCEKSVGGGLIDLTVVELILHLEYVIFDRTVVEADDKLLSGLTAGRTRDGVDFCAAIETDEGERRIIKVAPENSRIQDRGPETVSQLEIVPP